MDLATAAAYLAMSPASVLRLTRREGVAPLNLGLRLRRWRRADLDALLARLPAGRAGCADPANRLDLALEAVERRLASRTGSP